ncbi:MAG: hypothetical protein WCJ01_04120 [Ignavibacteria bacterium]
MIQKKAMGGIIFWAIVRMFFTIPIVWYLQGIIGFRYWWILGFGSIYGIVIHPAIKQLNLFELNNKEIVESTLCSSCENFDKTAVLCIKYDQHPTLEVLPCDGADWTPTISEQYEEKENDNER